MGEARALCGLSETDLSLGDSYAAIDELLESLAIRKKVGDRKGEAECLRRLSHAYTLVGKLSTARKVTEQARQLAMENGIALDDAKADMLLAKIDMEAGDLDSAIEGLQRARDMYAKTVMLGNNKVFIDPHMLGQCLGELGNVFMLASKFDRSHEVYEQAEQLLEAAEEIDEISNLRCRMGLLASVRKDGSTKPSAEMFEHGLQKIAQSLQAFEKIGSRKGIARCILYTGIVLCRKGEQQKGMQKLRLALDIFKELSDKRSMAETFLEMGVLSSSSPQGVVYLEQSLMLRREASDLAGEAKCLRSLADLHSYLGNSRASIKCWQDCLSLKKELQDNAAIKQCLEHLCALYIQLEDYSRVSDYISQLRDIAHSQRDHDSEAQALLLLGKCNFNLGSTSGAEENFKLALRICQENSSSEQLLVREAECHDKLAQLYLDQGRTKESQVELEQVQRLKKKLGKDMLRGILSKVERPNSLKKLFHLKMKT